MGGYGYGGYGMGGYGYGYDPYTNYTSYALMAQYASAASTSSSTTVVEMLDTDRYYCASLYGPGAADPSLRPRLELTFSLAK